MIHRDFLSGTCGRCAGMNLAPRIPCRGHFFVKHDCAFGQSLFVAIAPQAPRTATRPGRSYRTTNTRSSPRPAGASAAPSRTGTAGLCSGQERWRERRGARSPPAQVQQVGPAGPDHISQRQKFQPPRTEPGFHDLLSCQLRP